MGLPCPLVVTVAGSVGVEGINMWPGQTLQLSSTFYISLVYYLSLGSFISTTYVAKESRVTAWTYDVDVAPIWIPYSKFQIEKVQRTAARCTCRRL